MSDCLCQTFFLSISDLCLLYNLPPFCPSILQIVDRMENKFVVKSREFNVWSMNLCVRVSHLKPCFDLCICHFQPSSQSCPLCRREIFLFMESLLQLCHLDACERGSGLFSFWWRSILVWMPNAACDWKGCLWGNGRRKAFRGLKGESNYS